MAGISKVEPKCAKCGACAQVCPIFLETGRESHCARGKLHLLSKGADYSSDYFNSLLSKCIQCGACNDVCPRDLGPSLIIRKMRHAQCIGQESKGYTSFLARQILNHPPLLSAASVSLQLLEKLPNASGLRQKISTLPPHRNSQIPQAKSTASTPLLYYPGCLAHHFQTDIEQATRYLASLCGYSLTIPPAATCCGLASSSSGKAKEAHQQALLNIKAYATSTGPILTSCGSCYAQLKSYPHLFEEGTPSYETARGFADRVQEFSTFFLEENKLACRSEPQTVYYHDPCHLRFGELQIINAPRQLIRNLNGQGVVNGDNALGCCGQGGLFALSNPSLSKAILNKAEGQVATTPRPTVVTTCSSCLMGWQRSAQTTEITALHLSVFLAKTGKNC